MSGRFEIRRYFTTPASDLPNSALIPLERSARDTLLPKHLHEVSMGPAGPGAKMPGFAPILLNQSIQNRCRTPEPT